MTNVLIKTSYGRRLLALPICLLTLAACGGSSNGTGFTAASQSTPPATDSTGGGTASKASSSAASDDSSRAGSIDVCALLSPADASAVARARGLGGDDAATAKYKLIAVKQSNSGNSYPASSCKFTIAQVTSDNTGSSVTVVMVVQPAKYFDRTGTKIAGLGDEAYESAGAAEVRVGDLMLEATEDSGSEDFTIGLYRAMIPNLK